MIDARLFDSPDKNHPMTNRRRERAAMEHLSTLQEPDDSSEVSGGPFPMWWVGRVVVTAVMGMLIIAIGVLAFSVAKAKAHDAPTGWSYPFACCSNFDCRVVGSNHKAKNGVEIRETEEGYQISTTGEVLKYNEDKRIKDSPDGEFHWCSVAGEMASRTICLFVPPRGF